MYVNNMFYRAIRINLAGVPDFYAVLSSCVEPLPHQIEAVYHEMLPRLPLHYLLADDPGAGKTIMTGLFIKELIFRKKLSRCLIVSPGALAEQWLDELSAKFHLHFSLLTDDIVPDFCIARLDTLSRNKDLQQKISAIHWDLAVIDEAHKLSAQFWGNEVSYTKRYQLGKKLSASAANFLMLTATPHNGKSQDFKLFMSLIDKDNTQAASFSYYSDNSKFMHRLLKENLLTFSGQNLFPEREAFTVTYKLSPQEAELYEHVTQYVRNEFNRADRLSPKLRHSIGFALTILQRRLASSPEAVCKSLHRRLDRLKEKLENTSTDYSSQTLHYYDYSDDDSDSSPDFLTASETAGELAAEIDTLRTLAQEASELTASGEDIKWAELSHLLQNNTFITQDGKRKKLIIFTEHRDTLTYLTDKIRNLLGSYDAVTAIHGGMSRNERRNAALAFMTDDNISILVATDAAGEGINLQCSNLVINYDLPWNPNRLEQRFGRVHRIGQNNTCYLWNLVAVNTREGKVFERLLSKLQEEKKALGGQVFDVIGNIRYNGIPLQKMMLQAILTDKNPRIIPGHIKALIHSRSLLSGRLSPAHVDELKNELRKNEAHLLPPSFVEAFVLEALPALGGIIHPRENGSYEITLVPQKLLSRDTRITRRYRRICFDRRINAEVIIQGHPLLSAIVSAILETYPDVQPSDTTTHEGRTAIEQAAVNAVMRIERELGNVPCDVSAQKLGYDIESTTPEGTLRFIEVKGRRKGADTVTVTAGEIHSALQNPRESILAIVEVDGDNTHTKYLTRPFRNTPDDAVRSITFDIAALVNSSECVYKD